MLNKVQIDDFNESGSSLISALKHITMLLSRFQILKDPYLVYNRPDEGFCFISNSIKSLSRNLSMNVK